MVNNIPAYIDPDETVARDTHAMVSGLILNGQLDPAEVSNALADLTEPQSTPEELFLPARIMESITSLLNGG